MILLRLPLRQSLPRIIRSRSSSSSAFPRTISALIQSPPDGLNDVVTISGWVRSVRRMKNVSFAHISDGSTSLPLQAVLTKEQAEGLTMGASVKITGEWKESIGGKGQQTQELLAQTVEVLGEADPLTYPLQKKYQTPEYLRTLLHLRPRIPANTNLLCLRSHLISTLTSFFAEHSFVQCHPPIITSSDCEGAGEVFTITRPEGFFRGPKYLTVSSQLHLEALSAAIPRVWTLGPTFRAEKSDTARHLSEFYMLEAEVAFIDSLDPLMSFIEEMVKTLVRSITSSRLGNETLSACDKAAETQSRWTTLAGTAAWPRTTYTQAISTLQSAASTNQTQFVFPPTWGAALQAEHERFLAQTVYDGPVFVTDYPKSLKPFYMLPSTTATTCQGDTVACFDLLLPSIGELIGGSLREHRYEHLLAEMKHRGMAIEGGGDGDGDGEGGLNWYLELRKWGSVRHGGFGLGFDRLVCYLAGVENIREVVAFPRWVGRCDC